MQLLDWPVDTFSAMEYPGHLEQAHPIDTVEAITSHT